MVITISISYSRKILNLEKIYTNEAKYNKQNNSFTFKLKIFYNIYIKANIVPKAKIKTFSIILKGLALDYYYLNISISGIAINFNRVYYLIKNYFERLK